MGNRVYLVGRRVVEVHDVFVQLGNNCFKKMQDFTFTFKLESSRKLQICHVIDALCNVCTKCRETGKQLISKVFFQAFDIQHQICQYLSMLVQ